MSKVLGIQHVAIAVEKLEEVLPVYRDLFGLELQEIEEVPDQKVRVAILKRGEHRIELLEPTADDSPVRKHIDKRGPGLHHICLDVQGLAPLLDSLKSSGVRLIDEQPKPGADSRDIAFVHPKATQGVLIELSELRPKEG